MLLVNALGLIRDIKVNAENSGGNAKSSLAAQRGCCGNGLVDVKKGSVNLRVTCQGVGLEVKAADARASLGDLLEVS